MNNGKNLKHAKKAKLKIDDHVYTIHEYGIDYENNELYLFGNKNYIVGCGTEDGSLEEPGVEFTMANQFIMNLHLLMKKGPEEPILIHMKTCGGDWQEGMAIYDAIQYCPNPITILCYTHARSMSSLIFLAADKRVMFDHSRYMFHDGTFSYSGTVKQYLTEAEQIVKDTDDMLNTYVKALKKSGKMKRWSKKRIRNWLTSEMNKKEEVYFSAKEAVEAGFAHEVFNGDWDKLKEYDSNMLDID